MGPLHPSEDHGGDFRQIAAVGKFHGDLCELVVGVHASHVGRQRDLNAVCVVVDLFGKDLEAILQSDDAKRDSLDDDVAADGIRPAEKLRAGDRTARFPTGSFPPHLPFVRAG